MKRANYIYLVLVLLCLPFSLAAQSLTVTIVDGQGEPQAGIAVSQRGNSMLRAITGDDGKVTLEVPTGTTLEVMGPAGLHKTVRPDKDSSIIVLDWRDKSVTLGDNISEPRETTTASISTVTPEEFLTSAPNPGNALYGKVPGLYVMQGTNVAWDDDPNMFIRGIATLGDSSPLVLIDGFERPLSSLSQDEIESISVIKDAAALSLYGMRGANGVIYVKTKRGTFDELRVKVAYQFGMQTPFRLPEMVDSPTYANAMNEARLLDGLDVMYNKFDLRDFASGNRPELYPNVNWVDKSIRDMGYSHQASASFEGGGSKVRYYSMINYVGNDGFIRPANMDPSYSSQMEYDRLSVRTNLDIDFTKSTNLKVGLLGQIQEHHRPATNYPDLFQYIYNVPSAAFPVKTEQGYWGGDYIHENPIARIAGVGYTNGNDRALYADLRLRQDFSMITEGLGAEVAVAYDNRASYWEGETKKFQQENLLPIRDDNGAITDVIRTVYGDTGSTSYSSQLGSQDIVTTIEAKVDYNRIFNNDHAVSAVVDYNMQGYKKKGRNTTYRRQNIVGYVNYGYRNRYMASVALTYGGSSVMSKNDKFRVFPAVSGAWVISNEPFMKNSSVNLLKLRASWGMSGSDLFAYEYDKQFYTSKGSTYFFGENNVANSGIFEGRLPNKDLNCEIAYKTNVGVDLNIWNRLTFTTDIFYEKRKDILVDSGSIFSGVLGITTPKLNDGEVVNRGIEFAANWNHQLKDWGYFVSGNFTFARNKIKSMGEGYQPYSYLKQTGKPVGQFFGLQAVGFFTDEYDIESYVDQTFSEVRPGDIKYKDINGDKRIDNYDQVAMGYSTLVPEIYYGFSLGFNYKGIGLKADFQGVANYSIVKNMSSFYWPLRDNTTVSEHYMRNRWTPTNLHSDYPRLTTLDNQNNFRNNSVWLEDGSFLKMRNLEVSYSFPKHVARGIRAKGINVFFRCMNLFSIDNVKDLDPELMYASYPSYRSYHIGLNLEF